MRDTTILMFIFVTLGVLLLALAPQLSEMMVRGRARRLPIQLAVRMEEEWRGELNAIASRPGKLAFAIALMLTRRRAFVAPGEDPMTEVQDRPVGGFAVFGGWKTLLIVPTLICAIAAGLASHLLPNRYASEAMILVMPRAISKDFVPGLYDVPIEERFEAYEKMVKSRSSLTSILEEFRDLHRDKNMDERVQKLRNDISIRLNFEGGSEQSGGSIVLRYVGYDPRTAQRVTQKLTTFLIQRDLAARTERVQGTNRFLDDELQKLAQRVSEQGDRVARERAAYGPGAAGGLALDYDLLQSRYRTLFGKREEAKMALALENSDPSGSFQVVDSAFLPLEHFSPNRWAITGVGALIGFAVGGMAVAGLYRRQRRVLA